MKHPPAILIVSLLAACNAVLGLEERPSKPTGSQGGGGADLACGTPCAPDIPSGWSGPSVVQTGSVPPTCDATGLGTVELSLTDGIDAAPAECACACEPAVGVDCSAAPIQVITYSDNNCTNPHRQGSGVVTSCINLCCSAQSAHYVPAIADVSAASCASTTASANVPAATWAGFLTGCGPVGEVACAGGRCFEAPAQGRLCIYRSGVADCPAGPFSDRGVWYGDFEDSRRCEPCGCGGVDVADCNAEVVGYAVLDCNVGATVIPAAPGCVQANVDFDGARVQAVSPTGSCSPTGGTPLGQATPTQPTTVCCTP